MRVRLLSLLEREELGVGELTRVLQLPQSTVSRHLNQLRVAGWILRRAEGTASLWRLDELGPHIAPLWALVRDDHHLSRQHEEDSARLQAVLDARVADSRTFFGRISRQWDALRRELFGEGFLSTTLLSLLPDDLVVADLGCGTGEALVTLAPVTARVIGVDREQGMLDIAAERTAELCNVELRCGGLEDLPLCDGEVDAVLCMLVLHHVEHLERAFAEMRRILRPGGRIVLLDMIAHDRQEYRHTMGHVHLGFADQAIRELAAGAGLALRSSRPIPPSPDAQGPPLFVSVLQVA